MATLQEQSQVAKSTRRFLETWGLKQRYVAAACQINERVFSGFLTHRVALSDTQLARVSAYVSDYVRRNS